MDQHPIPQDVTGFQFKLIGTMTVKQFGYVASGVIMAVILYYMPLPGFFGILIKVLLIPLFGGSGAFIAFVPIEGRPVDVMAGNFVKAIFTPNQYVYKKNGRKFSFSTVSVVKMTPATTATTAKQSAPSTVKHADADKAAQLQALLRSTQGEVKNTLDQKEQALLKSLALPAAPAPVVVKPPVQAEKKHTAAQPILTPKPIIPTAAIIQQNAPVMPMIQPVYKEQAQEQTLTQQETTIQKALQAAQQEETTTHAPAAHQKVGELQKQLEEIHAQKQKLEQELLQLKSQLTTQKAQPAAPVTLQPLPTTQPLPTAPVVPEPVTAPLGTVASVSTAPIAQPQSVGVPASQYAKTVAPAPQKKADLPNISDTPNVVVGIVKDPRGNILPNMLVEVKDKDGNPVRAFKTNALGQFASATPLAKGIYTIELDDPKKQHSFDVIQITANDQIMLPIEIISHDAREELRKQLFN